MLTLSSIKNAGGAAKYYAKEDNYYLSEVDAKEASLWWGEGASRLGLSGKVGEKELQNLLKGVLPNGFTIGLQKDGTINHRAGYDLCFHAPKSVSILALDGEDKRFYNAHLDAVKETLKIIQRDCAQSKVYKNGKIGFEKTKNLTVALIRHTTSRELDLHLHHHALVMNVTQRQDNAWRALASSAVKNRGSINGFSELVYNNQIYYGLIYQSSLANKVVRLGCEIETVGPHGLWEIKSVPKTARDVMSKRRQQIEERIAKLNYPSKKAADIAALDTREKKPKKIKLDEIKQAWKEELASVGFSSKEFIEQLDKNQGEKSIIEPDNVKITETAKQAVKDAVEHLSQYSLQLGYEKIIAQSLEFSIGKVAHIDVINALDAAVKDGQLISLDKSDSIFVTKELLENEKTIMDLVDRSKNTNAVINLKDNAVDSIAAGEAKDCAINVLQSRNRLNLVEHRSVDSAEFNSAILTLAESSGKAVRILSPNRMMSNDINENIKRKPSNLWQWLVSLCRPEIGECVAGFKHKYKEEIDLPLLRLRQGKDVIVVNSSETLGCSDMKTLLELTEKTSAKVIFLRDLNAKHGFSAGNSMETLKQASIETFKINTVIDKTVNKIPELAAIQDDGERTKQLARTYALKEDRERYNTTIFVGSKEQLESTNKAIREELKNCGKLSGIEYGVSVLNPVYMSKPESTLAHRYQKNMVIRFYDASCAYEDWNIESVDREKNTLRLIQDGKRILWDPKKQDKNHENYAVFKKEILQIARGDKLIATANMNDLDIKNASRFIVKEINDKHIELLSVVGAKAIRVNLSNMEESHLQYDYATTLSRCSKKPTKHVLADIKAYFLDKPAINELTSRTKDSLTILTDNASTALKRFGHISVKLTATETLFGASKIIDKVDRFINDKTITEIKSDIEKAISALGNQHKLVEAEKKAVDFAIEKITSHNAGFTHKELVAEALTYALQEQVSLGKAVTHEDIVKVIMGKQNTGELVMGRHFDDGTRWTTKEILELERSIINEVKKGQDKLNSFLDPKTATSLIEKTNLTQDQKNACHLITTTKDQFVIVQGYAGTGKTTMFSHVQSMLKAVGIKESVEMLALAPTHRAVKELKSIGIEAQTLKSFLIEQQREIINSGGTNIDDKTSSDNPLNGRLIILDEVSMVSNKDFAHFLDIVGKSSVHVVFSGDTDQHIAIGSGKPCETVQRSNILKIVYLREIVRQKNPNLKTAVENIIHKDYAGAFEKIANENQQKHIERIKTKLPDSTLDTNILSKQSSALSDFFDNLKKSIVEVDNNKLKEGEKTLEEMVAEDFLSRTPQTQDKTVVIVHANHDRRVITGFIRKGLKDRGVIAQTGIEVNCLIPKGLTDIEHKSLQYYNIGDVVKFGKKYYHVEENYQATKSVLLKDETGKTKYFYPEKYVDKYNVELYEHTKAELAVGDTIRLTKTDKERELYANFEYGVKEVNEDKLILESKNAVIGDSKKQADEQKEIILNPKELKNAHWDYAKTVTGYGFQGGSKTYAIDFEVSYRKKLANRRSFYIGASRAIEHLTIYTDNKDKLLNRVITNQGNKYAALEVTGDISNNSGRDGKDDGTVEQKEQVKDKPHQEFYDAKEIKLLLNNSAESFVEQLLGRPNEKLSSASEWRCGNKGSLVISMVGDKKGLWYDFETGESGDLLTLLQKKSGMSFHESLKYVSNIFGKGSYINTFKQHKNDIAPANSSNPKIYNREDKTSKYARQLAAQSQSIVGTIAEKYLKEIRGINNINSSDIRYHPKVYTGKNEKQKYMPAMLSLGRDKDGNIQCVQATYLDPKRASKADLNIKKRTYASPSGALVSLQKNEKSYIDDKNSTNNKITFISEGVETGLSIKDAVKNSDVVVTLGKSNFTSIDPQSVAQKVMFCLDNDGMQSFTDSVIHKAAQRLVNYGKEVFISIPNQIKNAKTDFNDVARVEGIDAVRKHINNAISYEQFGKNFKIENKNINNDFVDNITKNNHGLTKQLSSAFGENKKINIEHTNKSSKNSEQVEQLIKKQEHLQVDKKASLDLEINIV